jgi:5-hydroxyisourate hydrolase
VSVSTHVLDAGRGRPAAEVAVRLERRTDGGWQPVADGRTDADGRIAAMASTSDAGLHRLVFDTARQSEFYPEVVITFAITDPDQHYHVPLLLSPYGYSTYRGS